MGFLYTVLIVGGIGLVLGIILSLASKFFAVPNDERTEKIRECLPGVNCGACGYSGCDGFAEALAKGEVKPNLCIPGGDVTAAELSKILGVEVIVIKKTATVHCKHGLDKAASQFAYSGVASCSAANLMYNGFLSCKYGCLGLGDCITACDFGALSLEDGNVKVNKDKCIGCGKCASACPKHLITIDSADTPYYTACSNKTKGAAARKECSAACIACKKCEKVCPNSAVSVIGNLAVIDSEKCTGCGECERNCPTKCIVVK